MSGPRPRPPSNRQRVEDYYGVHDTGMGTPPAAPQPGPTPPPPPQQQRGAQGPGAQGPGAQGQPPRRPRVIPPPEEQVAEKEAARAAAGAPPTASGAAPGAAPRSKPDPLTDPLTSETFQGVQPASDTFETGVVGGYGYSAPTGRPAADSAATGFDGGYDQFAPPRFEPRTEGYAEQPSADAYDDEAPTLDEPDESYIDVEVVDVQVHEPEQAPTLPEPLAIDPYPYTQIDESYVDAQTLQDLNDRQVHPHEPKEPGDMTTFNESLNEAMTIEGALGVALVDAQSGMALATAGEPSSFNLEIAAAGNSALVQAMSRTLGDLDLDDRIEDILITLGTQYQIVRPIHQGNDDLFLYLVLDRSRANLAMARFRLTKLADAIEV